MIANILMGIGIIPLTSCVVWTAAILGDHEGRIPMLDPIAMIGLSLVSFIGTFLLAGSSALWSWDLARKHPDSRSPTALAFRLMTVAVLVSPFVVHMLRLR